MLALVSLPLFFSLAAGVALGEWAQPPLSLSLSATVLAALATCLALRRRQYVALCSCATLLCCGLLRVQATPLPPLPRLCGEHVAPRAPGSVFLLRVAAPIKRQLEGQQLTQITEAELIAEQCGPLWQPRRGRIPLHLRPGLAVRRGDVLQLRLRLREVATRRHPQEPDPRRRARAAGWVGRTSVRSDHALVAAGRGPYAQLDRLRAGLAEHFEHQLPPSTAALAKALVLGDGSSLSSDQRDAWSDAGIAHLLSVSGLHVGLVAALLIAAWRRLLRLLPCERWPLSPRRLAALLSLPGVLAFCLLTGASVPALRASSMGALAALGMALSLPSAARNAWGVVGLAMVLQAPLVLFELGFLLSFAAVGALLFGLQPPTTEPEPEAEPEPDGPSRAAAAPPLPRWRQRLGRAAGALWAALAVSLAASWATLPFCAAAFGRISLAAPAVNLVAVPLGALLATPLALAVAGLAALQLALGGTLPAALAPLSRVLLAILQQVLQLLNRLANWVAALPGAALDLPPLGPGQALLYFASLLLLWRGGRRLRVLALLASCSWLGWGLWDAHGPQAPLPLSTLPPPAGASPGGQLIVRHLPVGQGDATLVTLPHGRHLLIDGGGAIFAGQPDPGRRTVIPLLRYLGVRRLELVVLTHPHPDHVGGLVAVARAFKVGRLWFNGDGEQGGPVRAILQQLRARGTPIATFAQLPEVAWLDGVRLDLLHPRPPQGSFYPQLNTNENSVVMRLQLGRRSVLLTGDIERLTEARLLACGLAAVDWLKVPHHGSDTSSTAAFIRRLHPAGALISCGEDNVYGLPKPAALQRYRDAGVPIWRTDLHGMVTFATDGEHTWVRAYRPAASASRSMSATDKFLPARQARRWCSNERRNSRSAATQSSHPSSGRQGQTLLP